MSRFITTRFCRAAPRLPALAALAALAACAVGGNPEIVASGNYVTTTHAVLDFDGGEALARNYCAAKNMQARHVGTDVETRTISTFECIAPGTNPPLPKNELKFESK
jgi:hypothetical protein